MNDGWPPGHDRWAGGPTAALAVALGLVERATDGARASGAVAWESRAAELYRAAVAEVLQELVRDTELLDAAIRQAGASSAAPLPHPDGTGRTGGAAVPHTVGGRSW
jgi:hypothetical protein